MRLEPLYSILAVAVVLMAQQRVFPSAGFSGRVEQQSVREALFFRDTRAYRGKSRQLKYDAAHSLRTHAEASKSLGDNLKNIARQVQGALPIVGLISRLTATSGGVGRDELAYPEFARQLLDRADPEFNAAVSEWGSKYDRVGQRKYIVLFLWMAYTGLGIVPRKVIVNAAMRLRVTHDITAEAERFELERQSALSVYSYVDRPKGKLTDQVSVAVDALCKLSIGLKDGEPIPDADKQLIVPIVAQTFGEFDGALSLAEEAVSDASRTDRKTANK